MEQGMQSVAPVLTSCWSIFNGELKPNLKFGRKKQLQAFLSQSAGPETFEDEPGGHSWQIEAPETQGFYAFSSRGCIYFNMISIALWYLTKELISCMHMALTCSVHWGSKRTFWAFTASWRDEYVKEIPIHSTQSFWTMHKPIYDIETRTSNNKTCQEPLWYPPFPMSQRVYVHWIKRIWIMLMLFTFILSFF